MGSGKSANSYKGRAPSREPHQVHQHLGLQDEKQLHNMQRPISRARTTLKHKTVKTNDKIRRFGVVMTPLSRKI